MPAPSAHHLPRRVRRAAVVVALALTVAVGGSGCVGRLGRNDDDVTPQSDHPKANQAVRIEVVDPIGRRPR